MTNFNHTLGFEWENLQTILDDNYDSTKKYRVHTSNGNVCYTIRNSAPDNTIYGAECEGKTDIYVDEGVAPNFYLRSINVKNILEISEATLSENTVNNTDLSVNPSTSSQSFTPSSPYTGYGNVSVSAVTNSIDNNITQGNIKSGVTILGVTGNYTGTTPTLTTKSITENGTYNASSDSADGYSSVTVSVSGGTSNGIPREISNGTYQLPSSNFTYTIPSGVTTLGALALAYAFYNCPTITSADLSDITTISGKEAVRSAFYGSSNLTSVDLSSLTSISQADNILYYGFNSCTSLTSVDLSSLTTIPSKSCFAYAFSGCTGLTSIGTLGVNLSSLTTVSGQSAMEYAFQNCSNITSIDLSSLTTVSSQGGMSYAFQGCTGLTSVNLSGLTTISGAQGMQYCFEGKSGITSQLTSVTFSALNSITSSQAMRFCFRYRNGLTSVSFPALNSSSFGSNTNQFTGMLSGVTGCTVHFPSNLQSVMTSWSDVTAGFGGTSTTVLFDLTATT